VRLFQFLYAVDVCGWRMTCAHTCEHSLTVSRQYIRYASLVMNTIHCSRWKANNCFNTMILIAIQMITIRHNREYSRQAQVIGYFPQWVKMQDTNLWLIIACAILKTSSVVAKNWQLYCRNLVVYFVSLNHFLSSYIYDLWVKDRQF